MSAVTRGTEVTDSVELAARGVIPEIADEKPFDRWRDDNLFSADGLEPIQRAANWSSLVVWCYT